MNQLTKGRVLLRWPPHYRKGPNRVGTVIYRLNFHQRKIVSQTVIAEMISEGAFGFRFARYRPNDTKISFSPNHVPLVHGVAEAPAGEHPSKHELRQPLRKWHHCSHRVGRMPTHKHTHAQRFPTHGSFGVMDTNPAMNLIMQTHFVIRDKIIAGNLHTVHADIHVHRPRTVGILG